MSYSTAPRYVTRVLVRRVLYAASLRERIAPLVPSGLTDFIELVLPELRRRDLFRTEYEGTTLRENLGLKRPLNRFAEAARRADAAA